MLKHTWSLSVRNDAGGSVLAATSAYTAAAEQNFDEVAPAAGTLEIDLNITVDNIKSFFIVSDKDVTLKTNSSSSPTQTKTLKANVPLAWNTDYDGDNPLTTDVTKLYFVNAGTADAKCKGGFLLDQNPA